MDVRYLSSTSLGIVVIILAALACGWPPPNLPQSLRMVGPSIGSTLLAVLIVNSEGLCTLSC